jgi:hypothetical protein
MQISETTGHKTSMENAKMIEKRVQNTHKRLFLESLHSVLDKRSTNEHYLFPSIISINLHAISAVMQRYEHYLFPSIISINLHAISAVMQR